MIEFESGSDPIQVKQKTINNNFFKKNYYEPNTIHDTVPYQSITDIGSSTGSIFLSLKIVRTQYQIISHTYNPDQQKLNHTPWIFIKRNLGTATKAQG